MKRCLSSGRASGAALVFVLVATACSRRSPPSANDAGDASAATPITSSAVASASGDIASAVPPTTQARGTATLILQHVEAVCIVGVGANGQGHFSVGTDILVETSGEADAKPIRDFVFCPKHLADGGTVKPRLDTWQNCSRYPVCKVVAAEAGADRVEILCGGEHVTLESVAGKTILRGSFGEREIAPVPMTIAPPKKESRNAMVDC